MAKQRILIIDDDVVSQRALKGVLDSEGWRVRIVPLASQAMLEIAKGTWSLVIVNVALTDLRGPIFNTLKDLAQGVADAPENSDASTEGPKRIRVLFLVPMLASNSAVPILEQEGLPYSLKPYHLHDFLEKVSDLLLEARAIQASIRSQFTVAAKRIRRPRVARDGRRGTMFASREDYQMTEEEMIEFERQEEEDRKKREKQRKELEHL